MVKDRISTKNPGKTHYIKVIKEGLGESAVVEIELEQHPHSKARRWKHYVLGCF